MKAPKLADATHVSSIKDVQQDAEDTTTLRIPTRLRDQLKTIAALNGQTLRDLTVNVLDSHVQSYEKLLGRSLPVG